MAILKFSLKHKNTFISEFQNHCDKEQYCQKFLPTGYTQTHLALLAKKHFSPHFGSHLEILNNRKQHFNLGSDFEDIFYPQGIHSDLPLFAKNRFPVIFDGHLGILHKTQKYIYFVNAAR